jgi:glycosyltransferase involved in cell wall biosynthesis
LNSNGKLKVAIDAQIIPGTWGGVSTAVKSLIRDLGRLDDGNETYIIVVESEQQLEWLKPVLGSNQHFAVRPKSKNDFRGLLKRTLGPLLPVAQYVRGLINMPRYWPEIPLSDGFWESLGCDVVHFPTQRFTLCALPSIYNPHDLQHLHYPQFFTTEDIARRETIYPAGCHFAHTVIVGSEWIKQDVVRQYRIIPEKVQVIPEGAPTQSHPEPSQDLLTKIKNKYKLEPPFMLYPAVTWPHKNHIPLLNGLAYLRDRRDLSLRLICMGSLYETFWPHIERRIHELNLENQVRFLGFVPEEDLRAIYRLSEFLIQPTLFEASSLPIFEAWLEGTPIACSNVTALPDQVLDAGLLFDPNSVESIANAIAQMATNKELREKLRARGYQRLNDFDCERTAKAYRAVYRRAAGFPITEEDRWLLKWDWMREPKRKKEIQ